LKEESLTCHIKICDHINAAKVNFTHLNYNEITYQNSPCTLNLPCLHLEENNSLDSTNELNYTTYKNPITGCEMLESLAYIIEKDTISENNSSLFWNILLDESNTITNEKKLAIVSKHFANNILVIHYIGMILLNETTAEAILTDLELFCIAKGLNLTHLIHFGSDGASNMTNDVKEAFNRESTNIALYLYDAMDQDFFIVTYFLADLFYILRKVINIFQSNYVSLGEIKAQLSMAIESITTEFIGSLGHLPQLGM
ncbi:9671_t:CDS:2, partial [Scutellospora calospora]